MRFISESVTYTDKVPSPAFCLYINHGHVDLFIEEFDPDTIWEERIKPDFHNIDRIVMSRRAFADCIAWERTERVKTHPSNMFAEVNKTIRSINRKISHNFFMLFTREYVEPIEVSEGDVNKLEKLWSEKGLPYLYGKPVVHDSNIG